MRWRAAEKFSRVRRSRAASRFANSTEAEIEDYIATGEPFDKAGAYGIQGIGGGFIAHVEGSRDNVMGLPTERVVAALARYGVKPV